MNESHEVGVSIPLAIVPLAAFLSQTDALFTATSALMSTAWFSWLFYRAWKDRRGP